jgi:CheY-like chemotaxis protein
VTSADSKRLLVVDDDKAIRHLLTRIAERAGFEVESAADGVEALEMLAGKQYDIAIVDLMMPRLSGYELVQKIGTLDRRPVVLVATAMANGDVASLDDSMVRRVIRKPFDVTAVASALIETARQIAEEGQAVPAEVIEVTLPVAPTQGQAPDPVSPDPSPAVSPMIEVAPESATPSILKQDDGETTAK